MVIYCVGSTVADPGYLLILDPGSDHFLIPDPNFFFILDPVSYMKSGMQAYFFLASYVYRSKVLVLRIVKNIRDPEKIHHGSKG
jgi:hypothetical protein